MNWVWISIAIIVYLGIIGLLIDIKADFNVSHNHGNILIKIFKIPVAKLTLRVEGNAINFTKQKKKKQKSRSLIVNTTNLQLIDEFKKNLIRRLYINNLEIDCFVVLENPAISAVISGIISNLLNILKCKVLNFQDDAKVRTNTVTGFDNNDLAIVIDLSIAISITDLIWAIIVTIFKRKRMYGKKSRQFNH